MRKPRGTTLIKLPPIQPDCCAECPLIGKIPKDQPGRPRGSKENHVCLGTWEAISGRGITVRASQKDVHHPLHRPCDLKYDTWLQLNDRMFAIPDAAYLKYRLPYEQGLQYQIKFHNEK